MNIPIRFCLSLLLAGGIVGTLPAQESGPPPVAASERSPAELDELFGPIALYPDDLIALILPAAAEPTDIVLAARYHENDGAMDEIDEQHWDESVRALAHFPDVIEWMSKNLSWTEDVGYAFLTQPAEVMKSIQRLRSKAYAAGTLRDTEHQKVLTDGSVIRIVSAEEDVIYVPRYRTEVVYVDRPVYYSEPWITFGIGWRVGSWHRWSCDWYGHRVWVFDHHDHWRSHRSHRQRVNIHFSWHHYDHGRAWHAPRAHRYYHRDRYHHRRDRFVHRPSPYVENEWRHRNRRHDRDDRRDDRRDSPRGDRRSRDSHDRGSRPDRGGSAIVNNGPKPPTTYRSVITGNQGGETRARDLDRRRDRSNDGDRRNHSPGSRNVAPSSPPVVAATPASPRPGAASNRVERNVRIDTADSVQRSRPDNRSAGAGERQAKTYRSIVRGQESRPKVAPPPARAAQVSRSEAPRASVTPPQTSNNRPNVTTRASVMRQNNNDGGRNRDRSSDGGRSRDSGRENDGKDDSSGQGRGSGNGRGR